MASLAHVSLGALLTTACATLTPPSHPTATPPSPRPATTTCEAPPTTATPGERVALVRRHEASQAALIVSSAVMAIGIVLIPISVSQRVTDVGDRGALDDFAAHGPLAGGLIAAAGAVGMIVSGTFWIRSKQTLEDLDAAPRAVVRLRPTANARRGDARLGLALELRF